MGSISLKIRYRPIRFGLCIRSDDFAALRTAQQLAMTMWGGRFCPIIPVDNQELADLLIKVFRVDVLWPITADAKIQKFIDSYKYLPNPFSFHKELFVDDGDGHRSPIFADIYHPVDMLYEEHYKKNTMPKTRIAVASWAPNDELADIILTTYGEFPLLETTGFDYRTYVNQKLTSAQIWIDPNKPLPDFNFYEIHLGAYCGLFLHRHYSINNHWKHAGLYIGNIGNFQDLVNFWNIRAIGVPIRFYDPAFATRLDTHCDGWLESLKKRPKGKYPSDNSLGFWHRHETSVNLSRYGAGITDVTFDDLIWNGMNLQAPIYYFSENSALAAEEKSKSGTHRVSFQLPDKPFSKTGSTFNQHMVVSVGMGTGLFGEERQTLMTPFISKLNEYYGRNLYFEWDKARAEPESVGVISTIDCADLSLNSLEVYQLISKIFDVVGVKAEPSKPGLIAGQLIRQMENIQGCRAFKIPGVRELIEKYKPEQSFTRGNATGIIYGKDGATGQATFTAHERIFIEPRDSGKLTPSQVFDYMLKKGIFRAGLKFDCPACKLDFWISIDEVQSVATCEYCGEKFNATPYLKDRDWAFRRSGLFGKDNHQEGAIPVILTLMTLNTALHHKMVYTTGMNLMHVASGKKCETDFVALIEQRPGETEIVIGECKTRQEISQEDVDNLKLIADAIKCHGLKVYVAFSKLVPFTPDEITRIKSINGEYDQRAILFTHRELEPYWIYERTAKELGKQIRGSSLEDMVHATQQIYYSPATPQRQTAGQ